MAAACCKVFAVMCFVVAVTGLPTPQDDNRTTKNSIQTENDLLDSIYKDCMRKDSISCVKYKLFSYVDKLIGHRDIITVTEGVQIVKAENGEPEGAPRTLSGEETVESLILGRVQNFLESHTIKIDIKGKDIVTAVSNTARSFSETLNTIDEDDQETNGNTMDEEGRGRRKRIRRIMGPLMAAAALKMAILGKLALAAIALIAGKALLVGKMALVISGIIGLKKLLASQQKHVTYEVVSHPQHSHSSHESFGGGGGFGGDAGGYGSSGHGGWGRALEAQQLAYKGQNPSQLISQ